MPRLYRPHIPLSVRVKVAERQLVTLGHPAFVTTETKHFTHRLGWLLPDLASRLGCDVKDLRLDHDPALGARPRHRRGLNPKTFYTPDANDPDHLFYRPHGPEFAGSHLIKTNVRGDHGQHPDRVLIKKARRQEQSRNSETRRKATGFPKRPSQVNCTTDSAAKLRHPKPKWPKRPFPKRRKP